MTDETSAATALAIAISLSRLLQKSTTNEQTKTHLVLSAGLLLEQVLAPGVAARSEAAAADFHLRDAPREERAERDREQRHDGREDGGEAVVQDGVGHPGGMGVGVAVVRSRTLEQ